MEANYSNRELNMRFEEIKEKLETILQQTTKTNGRVSKLEQWRAYILGAVGIMVVLVIPIATLVLYDLIRTGKIF